MCVSLGVLVATITTRSCTPYIGALSASVPTSVLCFSPSHAILPLLGFVSAPLHLVSALRLCASNLLSALLFSELCSSAFVSAFHSLQHYYLCKKSRISRMNAVGRREGNRDTSATIHAELITNKQTV